MAKSDRSDAKGAVRILLSQSGPVREAVDCVSDSHAIQFLTARLRIRFNGLNVRNANLVHTKFPFWIWDRKPSSIRTLSDRGSQASGVVTAGPPLSNRSELNPGLEHPIR